MTYAIDFDRNNDTEYVARLVDCDFVTINGAPLSDELKQGLKPVMDAFNAMPSFVVNSSGHLVDIRGLDAAIDATGKMIEGIRKDGSGKEMTKAFKTDQATELLAILLAEYWTCWVEGWIDFPAPYGQTVSEEFEEQMIQGTTPVKGTRKYHHLGEVSGAPNLLHLRIETFIEDPTLTKAVKEMLTNFDKANQKPSDPELDSILTVIAHSIIETKIDPTTLRPVWAKRSKVIRADSAAPEFEKMERVESHEYTFHWD